MRGEDLSQNENRRPEEIEEICAVLHVKVFPDTESAA